MKVAEKRPTQKAPIDFAVEWRATPSPWGSGGDLSDRGVLLMGDGRVFSGVIRAFRNDFDTSGSEMPLIGNVDKATVQNVFEHICMSGILRCPNGLVGSQAMDARKNCVELRMNCETREWNSEINWGDFDQDFEALLAMLKRAVDEATK